MTDISVIGLGAMGSAVEPATSAWSKTASLVLGICVTAIRYRICAVQGIRGQ